MDFYTAILPMRSKVEIMSKKQKFLLILNIGMLIVLSIVLWNVISKNNQKPENRIFPSVVQITDGNYLGNGSIINKGKAEVILVTTKHLLENGDVTTVTFFDGTKTNGEVVYISEIHDIGFVSVSSKNITEECYNQIKCQTANYNRV